MTARFLRLALAALLVTSLATTATATAGLTGTTAASADPIVAADLLLADALQDGVSRAGVASVDTSWHMGASGGQFADTAAPVSPEFVDPHGHAVRKEPTEELGSRILTRALVVQGADGERVAVVANDLYLPNDLLNRRVGQLLQLHDAEVTAGLKDGPLVGLTDEQVAVTVSHNHNSAFYSSPSWGVWIFQDVVDIRFFDYMAERMAQAVIEATAALRPVRMGAVTIPFNEIQAHTYGPKVGYDGTPAGQPYSHTTGQLSVVRFDDITDPAHPDPYAAWVILGLHPEWTWGYDVFNGDVTHAAMRVIDRELGVTSVMSQRETGSSGPEKALRVHEAAERREFQDNGFAGLDHAARLWSDRVTMAFDALDARTPVVGFDPVAQPLHLPADAIEPIAMVPFTTGFDVASASQRFAPPGSRPVPGVSNCNTDQLFHGNVQAPVLGFPDCENGGLDEHTRPIADTLGLPAVYDQLKAAGVPIPDSYTATTLGGVEETAAVHVMAMRIGDLGVTFCPCEQFTDTALNVQTRLDDIADNVWIGWDWEALGTPDGHPDPGRDWCVPTPGAEGMTTCGNPQDPTADLEPVPTAMVERMRAQIRNDADGWEADVASVFGESEAVDPAAIFGNFTHDEVDPSEGYPMVVSVGMANDYFGYVPNYREMRAHDHYRKALNGLGLHGADFLANRMVALGHQLNGGPSSSCPRRTWPTRPSPAEPWPCPPRWAPSPTPTSGPTPRPCRPTAARRRSWRSPRTSSGSTPRTSAGSVAPTTPTCRWSPSSDRRPTGPGRPSATCTARCRCGWTSPRPRTSRPSRQERSSGSGPPSTRPSCTAAAALGWATTPRSRCPRSTAPVSPPRRRGPTASPSPVTGGPVRVTRSSPTR